MYGLLTKCEVKMAGYWPSSFFAFVSVHKLAKKERHPAILTEQTWSIKDLLHGFRWNFFLRNTAGSPQRARSLHLARSDSQSHLSRSRSLPYNKILIFVLIKIVIVFPVVVFPLLPKYSDITLENYEFSSLQKTSWNFIQNEFGFNAHVLNNVRAIQLQPIGYITFFQIVPSIRQVLFKQTDTFFGYLT